MSNAGTIVTDEEVIAMVSGVRSISDREAFIIKAAEDAVQRFCGDIFASTEYTDDPHDIVRGELTYAGLPSQYRRAFQVNHANITEWEELKCVASRNSTSGAPESTTTVPRNAYYVDMKIGWVTLIQPIMVLQEATLLSQGYLSSWPSGPGILLCTYTAGFEAVDMPYSLKQAVLMVIDRYYHMSDQQLYHVNSTTGELGSTNINHDWLTRHERFMLAPFVRHRYA